MEQSNELEAAYAKRREVLGDEARHENGQVELADESFRHAKHLSEVTVWSDVAVAERRERYEAEVQKIELPVAWFPRLFRSQAEGSGREFSDQHKGDREAQPQQ